MIFCWFLMISQVLVGISCFLDQYTISDTHLSVIYFDFAMHWLCQTHSNQPLDSVCLAPHCQNHKVLCFLCKLEAHPEHHPVVPMKIFADNFLISKNTHDNFIREIAQIDHHFVRIQQKLHKMKNKFLCFSIVEEALAVFWRQSNQELLGFDRIVDNLATIMASNDPQAPKELNLWVERYSNLYITENEEGQNSNIYMSFLKQHIERFAAISQSIDLVDQKPGFDDVEIISLFHTEKGKGHRIKIHFSEDLKGSCMTIHSPTKASMSKSGNQRMMLLEPALNTTKTTKRWKVKIEKLASWIGVGISFLDKVKEVNFDFSYTSANHGNYLISSNGYSWNGYKMEFNSKFESFSFATGDIIEITYDPVANKVSFSKQDHDKTFTYDVDPSQKPIHASVNLTGAGDTVQIIN